MKKQRAVYRFYRYNGKALQAKIESPFEMKLTAKLILDQLCYTWNKKQLQNQLNEALDSGDKQQFALLSEAYRSYIWE